jgi:hypothetical protein
VSRSIGTGGTDVTDRRALPFREGYGGGVYRRRIDVHCESEWARAELEDDFHHFGVAVRLDGDRVAEIRGVSQRYPWTTCPAASAALTAFVGGTITSSLPTLVRRTDPDRQCTHQLDLACLAIACAALGTPRRRFEASVPELQEGRTRVSLEVDGETCLVWSLEGMTIRAPEPFSGRRLGGGFADWVERSFDPERAIAAHVLRRATFIGFGRQYDFDAMRDPVAFAAATGSRCHSFHPDVASHALRIVGSGRAFDDRPEALLTRSIWREES